MDNVRLTSGIIVAPPSMRKHVIAKREIVNVEQMTRTEKMTSAPVSDDSIFLHKSVIRGHRISKGYGLQEQERLYKFDKKQETLMIEMLWLCPKPMERWLDMCLALSCWVLLDSKAF